MRVIKNLKIIILVFIIFSILNIFSTLTFAQQIDSWLGITLTSFNTSKTDFYIPATLGDLIFYFISNDELMALDCDFINIHLLYQNEKFIYGFEFFYESGILRGLKFDSVIYPSLGGFLGFRISFFKSKFMMLSATLSMNIGFLYMNLNNIEYYDFNLILKFSHNLYIKLYKEIYLFVSLNNRLLFFLKKDSNFQIAHGNIWFGIEWKI